MTRLVLMGGLFLLAASAGCSTCCTPFDAAYPTYGGKWERSDRFYGRAGSAFAPAGAEPGVLVEQVPTPAGMSEEMMSEEMMPEAMMSDEPMFDLPPGTLPDDDLPPGTFESPEFDE